ATALAQEVSPPAGILHDGIPPVPKAVQMEAYPYRFSMPSTLLGWDLVKPEPVVMRYFQGSRQAGRVHSPGTTPQLFTAFTPPFFRDFYYQPNGDYFIYRKDENGDERYQLYRYDVDTKSATLLTDGKSRNLYPIWSHSGKWLMYSSNRRNGKDLDIYMINPLDPKSDRMVAKLDGEDWAVFDWSADDKKVILSDYRSTAESYLWVFDITSGQKTALAPTSKTSFNGSYACFRRDNRGVYIISDRDSEFQRLAYVDVASGDI